MTHEIGQTICFKNGDTYTVSQIEYPPPIEEDGEGEDYDSDAESEPDYYLILDSTQEGKPQLRVGSDEDGHEWYTQESDTQTPRQFWLVKAINVPDYDCFCEGVVVATSARQAREIAYRNLKGSETHGAKGSGSAPFFWLSSTFSTVTPMDPTRMNGVVISSFNAG